MDEQEINPYASPEFAPEKTTVVAPYELRKTVRAYRSQWHILGAQWIIMGIVALGLAAAVIFNTYDEGDLVAVLAPAIAIYTFIGAAWFLLGISTCRKQLGAAHAGLIISYLVLLLGIVTFNLCLIVIVLAAIVQAHRVLSWAKYIQQQGLPLTIRPQDIETPIHIPPT